MKRLILELGAGNDLYGMDYTKAAKRAVQDALHHSSLTMFKSLALDSALMEVRVTIGVQDPEQVDLGAVAATLPRGQANVKAVFGGQNVEDGANGTTHVVATAAIEAYYPL
ncbi:MAG: Lin0512 family protein [Pseudomonadota bacterium]